MWIYEQTEPENKLALVPQLTGITPEQIAGRVDIVLLQEKRK